MENKTNNKTNKDHTVSLQSQLGVKDDMRHWDIYSSDSNVLSEEEQLQKIMLLADDLYYCGHYLLSQFSINEELIESLYAYASSKGITLEAQFYEEKR
tara:strand:- start:605 stop:898 length:294 start_codon:yes stop_codon:yes gene_type:complete